MPAEIENPYPQTTAAEIEAVGGSREQRAARIIAQNAFDGIPRRAFLLGQADHSPVVKGIVGLTTAAYKLVDLIDNANNVTDRPTAKEWSAIIEANADLVDLMEKHGCP